MPENQHVLIGTPAYGGMVHVDYLSSIADYFRAGIRFTLSTIGNESLITRARNAILSQFHADQQFSHLLFLDGDVFLPAWGLKRLLGHGADVVSAPVALKGFNARGEKIFNVGPCLGERGPLHSVVHVGTAALMLSRAAVDALVAEAIAEGRVYRPQHSRGTPLAAVQYDVFRVGVVGGTYLSEDFWICHRLREMGFQILCDPEVPTRHQGVTEF
ncbi:hypothetical protein F2Q65_05060 [Thiohalocapsa marina]|uniref:Glycosyltransferase n=1 Tax=Thiohalocapsa marina TaxID=424902 RepID=A0A5M8FPN7_9GAMM|nr:hypothetical protein [Thiohalocapsa marina]KAA6186739.1 hypothetical protein F2Q65_05060 [Thiohalocapsa marina]